jgi:hypothetical protein
MTGACRGGFHGRPVTLSPATRRRLEQRRRAETFLTAGFHADGALGEIFISTGKSGTDLASVARDAGVLLSLALQHGVPPEIIRHAVTRGASEEPASILGAVVDSITTNHFRERLMGVDRDDFSDADPIAFDAAQAAEGIQPPHSVMFRLSVKQSERFEDLVARAGP